MSSLKRLFKRNSHNALFKALAGFGRALNRFYENRNHDPYSNGELNLLKRLAKTQPAVMIDGGANVGSYSLMAQKCLGDCRIYAFEPVPDTFAQLQENVQAYEQIRPLQQGLYRETLNKEIHLYPAHTHASLYQVKGIKDQPQGKVQIQLIRGDEFLESQGIEQVDFLKLDLEGAEFEALLGFEDSFRQGKIRAVQFEYGYINISTKKLLVDYYAFFEAHGYRVGKIFPKSVEFRPYAFKYEDFLGPNFLAVREGNEEMIKRLTRS